MIKVREHLGVIAVTSISSATVRLGVGMVVFAATMVVAAHVRIHLSFTPVPVTLQTGVVLLAGATLGVAGGVASQVLWICAGLLGAPVFAGAPTLTGPTLGYIIGFVPAAMVVGLAARGGFRIWHVALGMVAATAIIYGCGVVGLVVTTGLSWSAAVGVGVLPFLPGDALKLAGALGLSRLTIPLVRPR